MQIKVVFSIRDAGCALCETYHANYLIKHGK